MSTPSQSKVQLRCLWACPVAPGCRAETRSANEVSRTQHRKIPRPSCDTGMEKDSCPSPGHSPTSIVIPFPLLNTFSDSSLSEGLNSTLFSNLHTALTISLLRAITALFKPHISVPVVKLQKQSKSHCTYVCTLESTLLQQSLKPRLLGGFSCFHLPSHILHVCKIV